MLLRQTTNCQNLAEARRSTWDAKPSAAGAASKGLPHESVMDHTWQEVCSSEIQIKNAQKLAAITGEDNLSPLQDNDTKFSYLSSDDDLKDYKDTMSRTDSAEWTVSIGEEFQSLKDHNVFMLIPWEDVPVGRKIIPLKSVFHYKLYKNGNVARQKT
jgi:hypothetical protein